MSAFRNALSTMGSGVTAAQLQAVQQMANAADLAAQQAATMAGTASSTASAAQTAVASKTTRVELGTVTVTYSATLAVGAGARWLEVNAPLALAGDAVFVSPTAAVADGYGVGAAQCLVDGKIRVCVVHPALALLASFSIPMKAYSLR
jgi:hypothetical protein